MSEPRQSISNGRARFSRRVGPREDEKRTKLRRIAKLRLGEKTSKPGGKEFPTEIDYFKLDVEEWASPTLTAEIQARFAEAYGARPIVIGGVYFISSDIDEIFQEDFEAWKAGKLFCHGDGDNAQRRIDGSWRVWNPCANADCPEFLSGACGPMSRLRFMLPSITIAGFFQIDTGSWNSSRNIQAGLNLIEALTTQLFGTPRVAGIPLVLSRAPEKIEYNGKLNTHYLVNLTLEASTFDGLRAQLSAGSPKPVAQIPGTVEMEIPDDEDDLPEDHVPESEQAPPPSPELLEKISLGFDILGTSDAQRASALHRYKGREAELLAAVHERIAAKNKATAAQQQAEEPV